MNVTFLSKMRLPFISCHSFYFYSNWNRACNGAEVHRVATLKLIDLPFLIVLFIAQQHYLVPD